MIRKSGTAHSATIRHSFWVVSGRCRVRWRHCHARGAVFFSGRLRSAGSVLLHSRWLDCKALMKRMHRGAVHFCVLVVTLDRQFSPFVLYFPVVDSCYLRLLSEKSFSFGLLLFTGAMLSSIGVANVAAASLESYPLAIASPSDSCRRSYRGSH